MDFKLDIMKSEEELGTMNEAAMNALNRGDLDEVYVIRSEMNAILEEEERKPLDFHSDSYYVIAYLVCLDLFDLYRALKYAKKIKQPTERVLRRIRLIEEDLNYIEKISPMMSGFLNIARKGSEDQLQEYALEAIQLSGIAVPNSYGGNLVKIHFLKANAIIHYRLGSNHYAISVFEEARRLNPADTEILYYLIMALRKEGNNSRANELIEYVKRLHLKEDLRNHLIYL